jgi:hypothetical protein
MWNMNPDTMMVTYVASQRAMERYCREEGIPAQPLPDLVPNDADVLGGGRGLLRAVRRLLTWRRPVGRQVHATGQGAEAGQFTSSR